MKQSKQETEKRETEQTREMEKTRERESGGVVEQHTDSSPSDDAPIRELIAVPRLTRAEMIILKCDSKAAAERA